MKQSVARPQRRSRNDKPAALDLTGIMTVEEAALAAKVSVATIWRWRNEGRIQSERLLGRTVFRRSEVEAALERRSGDERR